MDETTTGRATSTKKLDMTPRSIADSSSLSNKSFTPGMIAAASRPVTQQGMTGLRPPQTASGLNRQYHDKRYFISQIQNHMLIINEEINNLKKLLAENKLDATNYEECKRLVEELSNNLLAHEETLIMFNTAIETSMFKGSKSDIDSDAEKIRKSNQQKINQLESIFSDKMAREEQLSKLEQQVEVETQLFNDLIATLSEEKRHEYEMLWQANEEYKKQEENIGKEIKNLRNSISLHEQHVVQNEKKRLRYNLLVKLHELNKRCVKIREDNTIKRSPSQEREYLLEQVKQDRADIDSFKTQQEDLKAELEKLQDRYSELEDELSEKNSARLNKYRELLKRQETMDTFLDSFYVEFEEAASKIADLKSQIVFSLEYISGNSDNTFNIEESDEKIDTSYTINPNLTKDELQQEFKKLSKQFSMYSDVKSRLEKELIFLQQTEDLLTSELESYENIEGARLNLMEKNDALETQKKTLEGILNSTQAAVVKAETKVNELNAYLNYNEAYKVMSELEDKFNELKEENMKHINELKSVKMMDDFEKFKTETLECVSNILEEIKKIQKN